MRSLKIQSYVRYAYNTAVVCAIAENSILHANFTALSSIEPELLTAVASLGWVTPGAATEGVTTLFFPEKPGDLFCLSLSLSLYRFLLLSLGCHPLQGGVSPSLPVRPRFSTILCKFAHKIFFLGVSPPAPL